MAAKNQDGPDKGWSWVVAFAACFNSLILAGIFRTGGVLFVAFIGNFGVSREEASWPMVICISVLNLTGPFAGLLGQKYGVRPVTITGALVATVGISGCYFTTSLTMINLLFGVIFGIGYGLVNTLMPVIVNVYFVDLRATANGIANSGSCIGSLILPAFFEYLIYSYGLAGCFLLTGGVVLHVAVSGALLRPPSWVEPKNGRNRFHVEEIMTHDDNRHQVHPADEVNERRSVLDDNFYGVSDTGNKLFNQRRSKDLTMHLDPNSATQKDLQSELSIKLRHRSKNQKESNTFSVNESTNNFKSSSKANNLLTACDSSLEDELVQSIEDFEQMLENFSSVSVENKVSLCDNENTVQVKDMSTSYDACPIRQRSLKKSSLGDVDDFTGREICNLSQENNDKRCEKVANKSLFNQSTSNFNSHGDSYEKNDKIPRQTEVTIPVLSEQLSSNQSVESVCVSHDSNLRKSSLSSFDSFYTVLASPMFYITAITNVSFYFLFHMYVVVIVDYALDVEVPERDTKFIIFAFSISDLFGRLCLGWITDRKYLRRSHFVMGCMSAIGMVYFFFPFARSYWSLIAVSCCYGLLLGCTMVVFPILLVDFLGSELHAVAYGCMCFMNGFASFGRPFLIGYFRDNLGSYANIFYICGIISVTASLLWLLENCFLKNSKSPVDQQVV